MISSTGTTLVKAREKAIFRMSWPDAPSVFPAPTTMALESQKDSLPACSGTFVVECKNIESLPAGGEVDAK